MIAAESFPPLLAELSAVPGLAGHEGRIGQALAAFFRQAGGTVTAGPLGSVIARFGDVNNPGATPRIAVLAHMDTVGFLVKQVSADGILRVVPVGGVNARALPGAAVRIGDRDPGIPGVIGVRSQHLARSGEGPASVEDLYIQVDPARVADIPITAPVTYAPQSVPLGDGLYAGTYLDNRAGCAVLVAITRWLADHSPAGVVTLIGTVQEETTCYGAVHALQRVAPDAAIFIDGTLSYDTPETQHLGAVRLGGGPVLTAFLYTSGLNGWHAQPALRAHLLRTASAHEIPVQQDAIRGLMSDARTAAGLGVPSVLVGLPMRGKHAPLETVHLDDLAHAVRLVIAVLERPLPDLMDYGF
ncbi:MAG: M20/M25/M40 family metallo-hydrolase [Anaerolineae bacterium]|nr:M20/M25/M40 family metallo-hydrolase [Anaerolineae bacterium]